MAWLPSLGWGLLGSLAPKLSPGPSVAPRIITEAGG